MSRITNHPILGETPERKLVKFTYNGKTLEGYEGEPIASDGKPNVRTCITPLAEGMTVETQYGVSNKKEEM